MNLGIEWYMAGRARIVYNGQQTITGAAFDKPDSDPLVQAVEGLFNSSKKPLDAFELVIAGLVDGGAQLPVSNPEAYMAAQWLAQGPLGSLPDPMPRAFVLYFAKAFADVGTYPSMTDALKDILATRTFM